MCTLKTSTASCLEFYGQKLFKCFRMNDTYKQSYRLLESQKSHQVENQTKSVKLLPFRGVCFCVNLVEYEVILLQSKSSAMTIVLKRPMFG